MSKYASLPDLDPSQDVYETPDLADDVSTLPTTIGARTNSPAFSDDDRDHPSHRPIVPQLAGHYRQHSTASAAALAESIDRTRLKPSTARNKFLNTEVDASHVDFSDRVGGRKSGGYVTSTRKGRKRVAAGRRKVRRESESRVYYGEGEGGDSDDEELEGASEEEEEETLEGKLARLRRELEELKAQVGEREEREEEARKERAEAWAATGGEEEKEAFIGKELVVDEGEGMDGKRLRTGITDLSDALESLQTSSIKTTTVYTHQSVGRAEANLAKKIVSSLGTVASTREPTDGPQEISTHSESATTTNINTNPPPQPSYTITYAPTYHTSHALSIAADFDLRLTNLEKILGTTHSATNHLSNLDKQLPANAIIPTLDDLARQISVLTSSNQPFVDALNRRVKTLTEQAEKLADARRTAARAALEVSTSSTSGGGSSSGPGASASGAPRRATVSAAALTGTPLGGDDDPSSPLTPGGAYGGHGSYILDGDRETKINALYGVLPTIQQLGPLLPSVLDRLRSLRAIHADAGRAAEGLEGIEKRQEEVAVEITKWREALEKVEGVMKDTEGVFMGNVGKVEEWVKGLEKRMEKVEALYNRDDSSDGDNIAERDEEKEGDADTEKGEEDVTEKE